LPDILKQREPEREILIKKPQISENEKRFRFDKSAPPFISLYIENEEFSIYCSLAVYRKILSADKKALSRTHYSTSTERSACANSAAVCAVCSESWFSACCLTSLTTRVN